MRPTAPPAPMAAFLRPDIACSPFARAVARLVTREAARLANDVPPPESLAADDWAPGFPESDGSFGVLVLLPGADDRSVRPVSLDSGKLSARPPSDASNCSSLGIMVDMLD